MLNTPLATENIYHIFSKSITGFKIFNYDSEFKRVQQAIRYYRRKNPKIKLSAYITSTQKEIREDKKINLNFDLSNKERLVGIIAYCIMPTHIHLVLRQDQDSGITIFMRNVLNSYTKYFNTKYKRKGPLWEARFKRVLIKTDEQLLHLTRYVHLNPVTAYLTNKPDKWSFSSYNEYLGNVADNCRICNYNDILNIAPEIYEKFTNENIDYQRKLASIKNLTFDQDSTP